MTTRGSISLIFLCIIFLVRPAMTGWQQTFAEEFNSASQLNSTQWIPAFYWQPDPSPNNELQTYRPESLDFSSTSSLGIRAWTGTTTVPYYSGVITSKDRWNQVFGYFEFRARFPTAKGVMASFSLLQQDTTMKNQSISFHVVLDDPSLVYVSQCGTTQVNSGSIGNLSDQSYHKFGIEWSLNVTKYYIDEVLVLIHSTCIDPSPMYIATHLIVGGPIAGSPTPLPFTVTMDVDYIRAYTQVPFAGISIAGPGAGILFAAVTPVPSRLTIIAINTPADVFQIGDNVYFWVTFKGAAVPGGDPDDALYNGRIELSLYPLMSKTRIAVTNFPQAFIPTTGSPGSAYVFSAVSTTNFTAGYYRAAVAAYEANKTKLFSLNSAALFQVGDILSTTFPVSPPVSTSVTSNVIPILDCYSPINTTHYRAYFSYNNTNNVAVSLPVGDRNKFTPGSINLNQPTVFAAGRSSLFPNSVFQADISGNVAWTLSNYQVSVDVTDKSSLCSNSVTLVISVSSSSSLNDTQVKELKDVIAAQLNVTSDKINLNVTCTSTNNLTNCDISVTLSADPSQLSDLIQKAKDYTNDPATVDNNVKQVSPTLSVTQIRGSRSDTEKSGSVAQETPQALDESDAVISVQSSILFVLLLICTIL